MLPDKFAVPEIKVENQLQKPEDVLIPQINPDEGILTDHHHMKEKHKKRPFYKQRVFHVLGGVLLVLLVLVGILAWLSYGVYKDAMVVKASLGNVEAAAKSQ